jgi:dolichol-phosphate mannosyltransferase
MEVDRDEVCILIPALNEEPTIGPLIDQLKIRGFSDILVVDGRSTDKTRAIAHEKGARIYIQEDKGKGAALIEVITSPVLIQKPYVLMLDADGTNAPEDDLVMLAPLFNGADQVIGNRLIDKNSDAFLRLNLYGNKILNHMFKVTHGKYLYDILSGYRAFKTLSLKHMHLTEQGFGIETELAAESVRQNDTVVIVPISYGVRKGTATKLNPLSDGIKIGLTMIKLSRMSNPLIYFGMIGLIPIFIGGILSLYIIIDWFLGIEHVPLMIASTLLIILGTQLLMMALFADLFFAYHREVLLEIRQKK